MKIALLADSHFGVRNDGQLFLNENKKFFDTIFFPYIDKHNIKTVIHLGDLVDRRKYINYYTSTRLRNDFLNPLVSRNITAHFIAGNHDVYFKSVNNPNALRELKIDQYPNFYVYDGLPEEMDFDGLSILFIPWINNDKDFIEKAYVRITNSLSAIAIGHLEIAGFEMYKGTTVSHGDNRDIFTNFNSVFSGHFHHKSSDGHIFYLGTHSEFTWSDYDDDKGFHIFDTDTREIEFIQNPNKIFKKIIYNDSDKEFLERKIDYSEYKDCIVKVIIKEKSNIYWFDKFIENLETSNPYDYQIIEDSLNLSLEDTDIVDEAQSTLDICYSYIDKIDKNETNKNKVKNMMTEIYYESMAMR